MHEGHILGTGAIGNTLTSRMSISSSYTALRDGFRLCSLSSTSRWSHQVLCSPCRSACIYPKEDCGILSTGYSETRPAGQRRIDSLTWSSLQKHDEYQLKHGRAKALSSLHELALSRRKTSVAQMRAVFGNLIGSSALTFLSWSRAQPYLG